MPTSFGVGGRRYSKDSRIGLQHRGHLSRSRRLTAPWPSLATAPVYNAVAVFYDHAGLQQGGQLTRPQRFTAPRLNHLSEPPLMLRSYLRPDSCGLVYINTPGRIFLDEQVTI